MNAEDIDNHNGEPLEPVTLSFIKYKPDNIDATFVQLGIVQATGTVTFRWPEEQFNRLLRTLNETGKIEITRSPTRLRFLPDEDYDT